MANPANTQYEKLQPSSLTQPNVPYPTQSTVYAVPLQIAPYPTNPYPKNSSQSYPYPGQPGFQIPYQPQTMPPAYPNAYNPQVMALNSKPLAHCPPTVHLEIPDDQLPSWGSFGEKAIRRLFIRKVYTILLIQLAFTFAVVGVFTMVDSVKHFVQARPGLYLLAYVTFLVLYIVLACCQSVRRKWPSNFIFLGLFTIAFAYFAGAFATHYNTYSVLMCFGICASCCLVITLFSFNTKYDLTSFVGALVIISWVLFLFGIMSIFTISSFPFLHKVYSALTALLFMGFLAIDTQMLMGNKKYSISPEDHIFASLQLYMDVMYIFVLLLGLFGSSD